MKHYNDCYINQVLSLATQVDVCIFRSIKLAILPLENEVDAGLLVLHLARLVMKPTIKLFLLGLLSAHIKMVNL